MYNSYGVTPLSCDWVSEFGGDLTMPFQEARSPALTNDLVRGPTFMQDPCCKLANLCVGRRSPQSVLRRNPISKGVFLSGGELLQALIG